MPNMYMTWSYILALLQQRQQLHDQTVARNIWYNSYDYIVVGAGSAGCIVAKRLAEDPHNRVLLIESGGAQDVINTDIPAMFLSVSQDYFWNYTNEPDPTHLLDNRRVDERKGKILGGGSSINYMIYDRGSRYDYDNYAYNYGARGWSYKEVLPYFIKAENNSDLELVRNNPGYHGTNGPIGVSSVKYKPKILLLLQKLYNSMGYKTIDINGAQQLGTTITQLTTKNGLRSSTANAYLEPNPYPHRLHILSRSRVTKILFDRIGDRLTAIGVQFIRSLELNTVYATKEVIICAGPISSPQLLMLSGIGPKKHLRKKGIKVLADLPVGQNYSNHPFVAITAKIDSEYANTKQELSFKQLKQLLGNGSGPLSEWPVLHLYYSTRNNAIKLWPNVLITASLPYNIVNSNNATNGARTLHFSIWLARVKSMGTLRLRSGHPLDYPLIDTQYLSHPQDMEALVESVKYVFYILESTPFAQYVTLDRKPILGCNVCGDQPIHKCDHYIRCFIRLTLNSFQHPVGTCRMGAINRPDVVVDEKCRVKYVSRLRVADTSIYPETPNANTNAAAILAGEKCSHMIKHG